MIAHTVKAVRSGSDATVVFDVFPQGVWIELQNTPTTGVLVNGRVESTMIKISRKDWDAMVQRHLEEERGNA